MKIQWENDLVERPFREQFKAVGWQWIEGDKDVPDFAHRHSPAKLAPVAAKRHEQEK